MRSSAGTATGSRRAPFQLNGHTYTLPINNGVNSLHGGFVGFGNHVWASRAMRAGHGSVALTMTLVSPNGDEARTWGTKNSSHCSI